MTGLNTPHKGACHCGSVEFEVALIDGLNTALRCSCSICRMRGAVMVMARLSGLAVTKGEDKLSQYQFGTNTAKHYFCSVCGVYTHHQRRFDPSQYAVNVACLEGVSPFDFAEVRVIDGVNHPRDTPGASGFREAGTLKFVKATDR
jgi:hypothetical protein